MDDDFRNLSEQFEEVFLSDHDIHLRSPFRLLDLPPELWLLVCTHSITAPCSIIVGKEPRTEDQVAILRQPALTRTCRLLRREALPLYYSLNTFEILHSYNIPCPRKWILAMGDSNRRRMHHLTIHSLCDGDFWKGSLERAGIDATVTARTGTKGRMGWGSLRTFRIVFE